MRLEKTIRMVPLSSKSELITAISWQKRELLRTLLMRLLMRLLTDSPAGLPTHSLTDFLTPTNEREKALRAFSPPPPGGGSLVGVRKSVGEWVGEPASESVNNLIHNITNHVINNVILASFYNVKSQIY